jgi:hypothetical protein
VAQGIRNFFTHCLPTDLRNSQRNTDPPILLNYQQIVFRSFQSIVYKLVRPSHRTLNSPKLYTHTLSPILIIIFHSFIYKPYDDGPCKRNVLTNETIDLSQPLIYCISMDFIKIRINLFLCGVDSTSTKNVKFINVEPSVIYRYHHALKAYLKGEITIFCWT